MKDFSANMNQFNNIQFLLKLQTFQALFENIRTVPFFLGPLHMTASSALFRRKPIDITARFSAIYCIKFRLKTHNICYQINYLKHNKS